MPAKPEVEAHEVKLVEDLLHAGGATHVRARKYGSSIIAESGLTADPVRHFRLRRDTVHLWCLDMGHYSGRWERTPFRDNIKTLVSMVIKQFPWTLTPIA